MALHKKILEWQAEHPITTWVGWGIVWTLVLVALFWPRIAHSPDVNRMTERPVRRAKLQSYSAGPQTCLFHCRLEFLELHAKVLDLIE